MLPTSPAPRASRRPFRSALRALLVGGALCAAVTTTTALAAGNVEDHAAAGDPASLMSTVRDSDWRFVPTTRGGAPFQRPMAGRITTPFHEEGPYWRLGWHPGEDIAAPVGTAIAAAGAGVVVEAGPDTIKGYGIYVKIDHGDGLVTLYAHMSRVAVEVGDRVGAGAVVGYVGMTGVTTGPHLHWEVRVNGELRDPADYYRRAAGDRRPQARG